MLCLYFVVSYYNSNWPQSTNTKYIPRIVTIDTNFNRYNKIQAAKKNRILKLMLTIMYID